MKTIMLHFSWKNYNFQTETMKHNYLHHRGNAETLIGTDRVNENFKNVNIISNG